MGRTRIDRFMDRYGLMSRWIRVPLGILALPFVVAAVGTLVGLAWLLVTVEKPRGGSSGG